MKPLQEEASSWPPAPKIDNPEALPKPRWSIWAWIGISLVIVVLGALFLVIAFIVYTSGTW